MKRFHIHLHVDDLTQSVAFYSKLFAAQPARVESDYAKWMLDDPRVNFAISTRGSKPGLDHLGFQVDDAAQLDELKARAQSADLALLDEGETTCCYARSEKHWITDPQGIAWEHYHTLGEIAVFNQASQGSGAAACCAPRAANPQSTGCSPTGCSPANASANASPEASTNAPARADQSSAACCAPAAMATPGATRAAGTTTTSCC